MNSAHQHHNHHSHDHSDHHDKHAGHDPGLFKQKFWLSLLLTAPTLVFSHSVQQWFGINWTFTGSEYIPAIFGTAIFFYGGLVFLKSAKVELQNRQPGMMTLIAMAISVAFGYSLASTAGIVSGMDFWWELATLVTIMLLGHWLEMASIHSAQGALNELAKLLPDEAELASGQRVPVHQLKIGDKFIVRPGGRIPADGKITNGESEVNESMLTGESKPVTKQKGSLVIGGTVNGSGAITAIVQKTGDGTALAGIMKLVSDAQKSKSKTQVLADRAAFYLTFLALGAAVVTALYWGWSGSSIDFILERVVTVLVVACPHALGLAIPLVTAISTTKAAKNGLLVRRREALEAARNTDVILFDKTGTLTLGKQGIVDIIATDKDELLRLAASVERHSEHPIAQALVIGASEAGLPLIQTTRFSSMAGRGVVAYAQGKPIYVGGPRLLQELGIATAEYQDAANQASKEGKTVVYVIQKQQLLGFITLADIIRPESKEAISKLQSMGKRVAMLTGDSNGVAAWVARELGLNEYYAEILPEHKADTVRKLQADGSRVTMVGDGVNDAPALATADIGIAIGGGTDVAIESAGIVLASSDPRGVVKIIKLSSATYAKMLQNLAWATGYNIIAIPLAAGVSAAWGFILSPAIGAALMSLSTIIVALNAQLLRTLTLTPTKTKENTTMKNIRTYLAIASLLALFGIVIVGTAFFASRSTTPEKTTQNTPADYSTLKGDAYDRAFLADMIEHHKSAINMARLAGNTAAHKEIRDLAATIDIDQGKEITKMQTYQKQWGYSKDTNHSTHDESSTMAKEMTTMNDQLIGLSGEAFDKAFLETMIKHHEQAVAMSRQAATNAKHQEVKNIANTVITTQAKEIEMMRSWQKSWGYNNQ